MNCNEIIDKIRDNLSYLSYDNVASVYNDILGLEGSTGNPVYVHYPDGADEPMFLETCHDES